MHRNNISASALPQGTLRPVERLAINQQIVSRLKEFLEHEQLSVGSKLPSERRLAAMLRVSRPSVREALRALSLLGVVKPKQGDGTYLASSLRRILNRPEQILTLQESLDLVELAEARMSIEPAVAALAALRASKDDLARIGRELRGMERCIKHPERFLRHDLQFHLAITETCGNEVLKRMMSVVLESLFAHSAQVMKHYRDLGLILKLHRDIFRALGRRDQRDARAAMIRHMQVSKRENTAPQPPGRLHSR